MMTQAPEATTIDPREARGEVDPLEAASALARTPFFAGLSSVELARVVPELEERRYEPGEAVFAEGDPPDGLYIIRRGQARVMLRGEGRDQLLVANLGPTEYFGEMGLVSEQARSATVEAGSALDVWRLSAERFRALAARHTSLPLEIAANLSRRLAAMNRELSRVRGVPYTRRSVGLDCPHGATATCSEAPEIAASADATEARARRAGSLLDRAPKLARASLFPAGLRQLPGVRAVLGTAVAVLLVAAWLGPPPPGMSATAYHALLLLVGALGVSLAGLLPDFVAFLLLLALWVGLGLVPAQVAASGFGNPTWFLMLATMMVGAGLARSGLMYRAALELLARLPARYPVLAGSLAGLGVLLSPGLPYVAGRVALLGPVAQDLADTLRYRARSGGTAGLALASLLGAGLMTSLFLTSNPMALVLAGLLPAEVQAEVSFVGWLTVGLPLHLVLFFGMLTFIVRRYRPTEAAPVQQTLQVQRAVLGPVRPGEWLAAAVLLLLLVGFATKPLHGIEPAWLGLVGAAVMFAGRLLDAEGVRRGVNWQLLLYLGVIISFGDVLRVLELDAWVAGALVPLLTATGLPSGLLIIAIALLALLTSLILGIVPTILLLALALFPTAAALGMNPWVVELALLVSVNQWLYPQQNFLYLSLYYATEERAFSHAQARPAALAWAGLTVLGLIVSVPYWHQLGLLW